MYVQEVYNNLLVGACGWDVCSVSWPFVEELCVVASGTTLEVV